MISKTHKNILNQPSYWVEAIKGLTYEAILEYMESHNLNKAHMAEYLGMSRRKYFSQKKLKLLESAGANSLKY